MPAPSGAAPAQRRFGSCCLLLLYRSFVSHFFLYRQTQGSKSPSYSFVTRWRPPTSVQRPVILYLFLAVLVQGLKRSDMGADDWRNVTSDVQRSRSASARLPGQ